ncbi:3-hydroxybutyryl-CoA dehydrogenase [Kroppenstedtia pulmonis]|uniref:3-hydroxybutyryl-CoA dehydrogenase n=1 Tax=Kroppenstedtia pulmonis TaxID=1380685 RepID=A0A7D4BEU9_9BACL|nr:3-hydroxyacyl-CoA dehydrogenase NAD-binding domain-containing protein [Kroppenstedtia pulmonis]QKG83872.1 3-hydroxybutyryl-CoA dehydrogenase [Kroppenstedtia pulmonis]
MADQPVSGAVLGAGTMGSGIAQVMASSGMGVALYDVSGKALDKGIRMIRRNLDRQVSKRRISQEKAEQILSRIHPSTQLEEVASAKWIVEAVVESLEVKQDLLARVEQVVKQEAVLATNTSSLSVTAIAAGTQHPRRVVGLHFFNPAPVMPLVEVVAGKMTDPEVVEKAVEKVQSWGKDPVRVKDMPGFLVNRVARPFHSEAYRIVGDGIAKKSQLDRILRSAGFKMGPFELQDLIGIDINYAASVSVYEGFFQDPRFRPHPDQRRMVDSGALGRKAGRGHYLYDG